MPFSDIKNNSDLQKAINTVSDFMLTIHINNQFLRQVYISKSQAISLIKHIQFADKSFKYFHIMLDSLVIDINK